MLYPSPFADRAGPCDREALASPLGPFAGFAIVLLSQHPKPLDFAFIVSLTPQRDLTITERDPADAETRVLKTRPVSMASDPSSGAITFWRHDPLHDVVRPMADHVIMAFPAEPVRFERRDGKI
jgi:hypothetical protein